MVELHRHLYCDYIRLRRGSRVLRTKDSSTFGAQSKSVSDTLERQSSFADKRRFYFRCSAKVRLRYSCVSCQTAFCGAKDAPTTTTTSPTTTTYSYSLWTRVSGGRESYSDSSAWYQVQCKKALVFSVKKWSFNFEIFNFWWCIMN